MLYLQSIKKNILYNYSFPNKQGFAVSKKIRPGYYIYDKNFIIFNPLLMYEFDISFSAGFFSYVDGDWCQVNYYNRVL